MLLSLSSRAEVFIPPAAPTLAAGRLQLGARNDKYVGNFFKVENLALKNNFTALYNRAFTERPDLKWKYHNPEKILKNNFKKSPKKFAKVPKMG